MRKRLLKWLVCPLCHQSLNLLVATCEKVPVSKIDYDILESDSSIEGIDEVELDVNSGALTCGKCSVYYPIYNGVPRMLTYPTRVVEVHLQENADWIDQNLSMFSVPRFAPPPGETEALRNFSREWGGYHWTGDNYWDTTPENMLRCMRYALGIPRHTLRHKLALEIGIGNGGIADALSRSEDCEIVGMDLSYAVDQARDYFGKNPRFNIVQASIFAPPFRNNTFDVVYSQGVIHHTYSTHAAFRRLAKLPKSSGGMLYVWMYSHEAAKSTLLRRVLMGIEQVVRPVLACVPGLVQTVLLLPVIPLYVLYQNVYRRRKRGKVFTASYSWNEALHAARDRLTPPYAHRHTYEEVAEWFLSEKYINLELLRDEPPPEGVPDTYPINVGIRGFLHAPQTSP
jgi:uncharacterized protein YbaR (Trm112 family)